MAQLDGAWVPLHPRAAESRQALVSAVDVTSLLAAEDSKREPTPSVHVPHPSSLVGQKSPPPPSSLSASSVFSSSLLRVVGSYFLGYWAAPLAFRARLLLVLITLEGFPFAL